MLTQASHNLHLLFSNFRLKLDSQVLRFDGTKYSHTAEGQRSLEEGFSSFSKSAMSGLELMGSMLQDKEAKYKTQLDLIAEDYKSALEGYKLDLAKHRQGILDLENTIYHLTERNTSLGRISVNKKTMPKSKAQNTKKICWL